MGIISKIKGITGIFLDIDKEGSAQVVVQPHPPFETSTNVRPFRQFFTDNGTATGSEDMIVNGSVTPQLFFVQADPEEDIYIKSISLEIGDSGNFSLNDFGALAALTNGVRWVYFTQDNGQDVLHDGIKTNKEFVRLGVNTAGIGDGTTAFLADVSGGGSTKSYLPIIDMGITFGMPWGLKLRRGSKDLLVFEVNDALAGMDIFNAIAYGIKFR